MNHKAVNAFSAGLISTAEEIAVMMGATLGKVIEQEQKRLEKKAIITKNIVRIVSELRIVSNDIVKKYA